MSPFDESVIEQIGEGWARHLLPEFHKPYMAELMNRIRWDRENLEVYPSSENVFRAFRETPFEDVKVVVIGQDPYHTPGMAHGLAFSVPEDTKPIPPSLRNIFQELKDDLDASDTEQNPDLTRWAHQGVLLLNTVLTVRRGFAGSHQGYGWEHFTAEVLTLLGQGERPLIFVMWGAQAQSYDYLIDPFIHLMLRSPHPSPFSASKGFFGSRPFSRINEKLEAWGQEPIDWLSQVAEAV